MRKSLAWAHRRLADREHADERRLLHVAPQTSDPNRTRAEAHEISAKAEQHRRVADRIDPDGAAR